MQSQETTNALADQEIKNVVRDLNALAKLSDDRNKEYYIVFLNREEFRLFQSDLALIKRVLFGLAGGTALVLGQLVIGKIFN